MFDIAASLLAELTAGRTVAVSTVVGVVGSGPRLPGSAMAFTDDDRAIGSISGGCIESDLYSVGMGVLGGDAPRRDEFGISDDVALRAGMACGGDLSVFTTTVSPADSEARAELERAVGGEAAALALVMEGPDALVGRIITLRDSEGDDSVDAVRRRVRDALAGAARAGRSGIVDTDCDGTHVRAALIVHVTPPRLIIVGAVDVAAALCEAASLVGYAVTVCDARPLFATTERFPAAAAVVTAWPDEYLAETVVDQRTAVCVLTHEERFATSAVALALSLPVGYVGAMGSRRTDRARRAALREAGVPAEALARLHSPIGLDLGGATPAETAISILAEIIAERSGRGAQPLRESEGDIRAIDRSAALLREPPDTIA